MVIKLKSAIYLVRSFREYQKGDLAASRLSLDKHFSFCERRSATTLAFSATLYLLERDMNSAKECFSEAVASLKQKHNADAKYVNLYCQYYLALIDDNTECDHLRRAALATSSKSMKRWLPLPDQPICS